MSDPSPPVSRVVLPASAAGARRLLVAGMAFLVVALLKPWGSDAPAHGDRPPGPPSVVTAAVTAPTASGAPRPATAAPSAGPGEIACSPSGWQVVSLDRLADWTVRTWIPTLPVLADGPLDPTIPIVALDSPIVLSVGACGPGAGGTEGGAGAMLVVAAWRIDRGLAASISLASRHGDALDDHLARLYSPIARGLIESWPAGRFVLELVPVRWSGSEAQAGATTDTAPRWYVGLRVGTASAG
jgi:hypothetical protein